MVRPAETQNLIHMSYNMGGKMENVLSVSTSCKDNPFCKLRHGEGMKRKDFLKKCEDGEHPCVCEVCFSENSLSYKKGLQKNLHENTEALAKQPLKTEQLMSWAIETAKAHEINHSPILRIESFGDLGSETQARNYIMYIYALEGLTSEGIRVAWWTKNWGLLIKAWRKTPEIIRQVLRRTLVIVLSSPFIGIEVSEEDVRYVEAELGMPVKVFTVDARESERTNCGARSCFGCQRCYKKTDRTEYVYEVVK